MALPKVADLYSARRSKENNLYSDFLADFNAHPGNGQLVTSVNEESVISSIKNLLLTNKYERLFQPNLGSNIKHLLFEPITSQTQNMLISQVKETIENYVPRATLIDVTATAYEDRNAYVVTIEFYVTSIENAITLNIPLYRVR